MSSSVHVKNIRNNLIAFCVTLQKSVSKTKQTINPEKIWEAHNTQKVSLYDLTTKRN